MIFGNGGHAAVVRDFYKGQGSIVAIGHNRKRQEAVRRMGDMTWGTAIHPCAYIARSARIEPGAVIMAYAVIQPYAVIRAHAIVNTCASVDHHSVVGAYAHIAPGAHLCGHVTVGAGTLVGTGVCVAPNAIIPAWSLVKARRLEIVALPDR